MKRSVEIQTVCAMTPGSQRHVFACIMHKARMNTGLPHMNGGHYILFREGMSRIKNSISRRIIRPQCGRKHRSQRQTKAGKFSEKDYLPAFNLWLLQKSANWKD